MSCPGDSWYFSWYDKPASHWSKKQNSLLEIQHGHSHFKEIYSSALCFWLSDIGMRYFKFKQLQDSHSETAKAKKLPFSHNIRRLTGGECLYLCPESMEELVVLITLLSISFKRPPTPGIPIFIEASAWGLSCQICSGNVTCWNCVEGKEKIELEMQDEALVLEMLLAECPHGMQTYFWKSHSNLN